MIRSRVLGINKNERPNLHTLVLVGNLCGLSILPLLKICIKMRPATIYYFKASRLGLGLAFLLKMVKLVSGNPRKVKDSYLSDIALNGLSESRFEVFEACIKNQSKISKLIDKCLPTMDSNCREVCAIGVRKQWQLWLEDLLIKRNLGKILAQETGILSSRVILVSSVASLLDLVNLDSKKSDDIEVLIQPFENNTLVYLFGPVFICIVQLLASLFRSLFFLRKEASVEEKGKARIGVAAGWGFQGIDKNRVDDFYWWRKSLISPERLVYMFEREDIQPTEGRLSSLKKLGIDSIALNTKYSGDAPDSMIMRHQHSLRANFQNVCFYSKLALRGLFTDRFSRSVISLVSYQLYKSEELRNIYKKLNLLGLFHFEEGGLEHVNLSAIRSNVIRIGSHWTCNNAPNHSTPRSHNVYFIWGAHDLKVFLDSGSTVKNMLISGCFLSDLSNKDARNKSVKAVQYMKSQEVRYSLALFDNSLPVPNFYQFFLQWLVDDPALGLLIKSKGRCWNLVREEGLEGLVEQAVKTGRLVVMDHTASPTDAAMAADFSVGVTSISAIAVSALEGARVLYVDYEKLDQGPLKRYNLLHSLGPKRCVFYDPESLKETVLEYFINPGTNPYLGDVSPVLDRIDPFRDGKASQRIGEFVAGYLEGLDTGSSPDDAVRNAVDKYAEKWGKDKVICSV